MGISLKKVIQKWESVRSWKMGKCTDLSGFDKSQIVMARPLGHKCTWGVKAASNRRATIAWITKIYNAGSDRKASGYSLFVTWVYIAADQSTCPLPKAQHKV